MTGWIKTNIHFFSLGCVVLYQHFYPHQSMSEISPFRPWFVLSFYVSQDRQLCHQILRIVSFLVIVYELQGLPRIHQRCTTLACGFPQLLYEALLFLMIWASFYFSSSQTQVIFCLSILTWKYKAEFLIEKVVSLFVLNSRKVAIVNLTRCRLKYLTDSV